MGTVSTTKKPPPGDEIGLAEPLDIDALRQTRHDIRNLLHIIKLSCGILQRRPGCSADPIAIESMRDIDRSVDQISHLVSHMRAH